MATDQTPHSKTQMALAAIALAALIAWPAIASRAADFDEAKRAYDARNYDAAFAGWKESALADDPRAQLELGLMLANGVGVPRDVITAYAWLLLAERGGAKEAGPLAKQLAEKHIPRYCKYDAITLIRDYRNGNKQPIAQGERYNSRCWKLRGQGD